MLPYWNSDLDLEIASWFPFGVDYQPISINRLYSPQLRRVAAHCLALDSEFLFMASPQTGCIGSLMRDNFYRADSYGMVSLGFMMILGYSSRMEQLVADSLEDMQKYGDLAAGVAFCSLWNQGVLLGSLKAIAVVSSGPFFEEEEFLNSFEGFLSGRVKSQGAPPGRRRGRRSSEAKHPAGKDSDLSFFAERFGYRRFCMPYETDDPLQLRISQLLYEMEFAETRQMVGPSPELTFPPFLGISLSTAAEGF
ncbi:MAG: hypothetical protein K6E38_00795 [Fretibacterium sp.]|nr:hypothetical protein [Fretibacterium sp.]